MSVDEVHEETLDKAIRGRGGITKEGNGGEGGWGTNDRYWSAKGACRKLTGLTSRPFRICNVTDPMRSAGNIENRNASVLNHR